VDDDGSVGIGGVAHHQKNVDVDVEYGPVELMEIFRAPGGGGGGICVVL
jgi:hypothetical protein